MSEERCDNCWWYWSTGWSIESSCHLVPKPKIAPCGYWEPSVQTKEADDQMLYQQYQDEWN